MKQAQTSRPDEGVYGKIEAVCAKDLTTDELSIFISNLRSCQTSLARKVNLNDLEALCT